MPEGWTETMQDEFEEEQDDGVEVSSAEDETAD